MTERNEERRESMLLYNIFHPFLTQRQFPRESFLEQLFLEVRWQIFLFHDLPFDTGCTSKYCRILAGHDESYTGPSLDGDEPSLLTGRTSLPRSLLISSSNTKFVV